MLLRNIVAAQKLKANRAPPASNSLTAGSWGKKFLTPFAPPRIACRARLDIAPSLGKKLVKAA
jgi:hypothetical protein